MGGGEKHGKEWMKNEANNRKMFSTSFLTSERFMGKLFYI